jgi:hypothetical protein
MKKFAVILIIVSVIIFAATAYVVKTSGIPFDGEHPIRAQILMLSVMGVVAGIFILAYAIVAERRIQDYNQRREAEIEKGAEIYKNHKKVRKIFDNFEIGKIDLSEEFVEVITATEIFLYSMLEDWKADVAINFADAEAMDDEAERRALLRV